MAHVDDGRLNALLDGELSAAERREVVAHLATCEACRVRYEEARAFLADASDLLGALDAPAVAARPASTVATTGKERAIEVEPVTQKSPAIRPLFAQQQHVETAEEPPSARRVPSLRQLAMAAMIALALGVGWMANELARPRASGLSDVAVATAERRQAAAAAESVAPPAAPAPAGGAGAARAGRTRTPLIKPPTARGGKPPTADVAADRIPRDRPSGARQDAAALARRAEESRAAGAGAPVTSGGAVGARTAPGQTNALEEAAVPLTSFRRITMDEAVQQLSGAIRLIDGMQPTRVEVGPGRLVPGAAPERDVVRVIYAPPAGARLVLDQQPGDPAAGPQASVNGLMPGDTLVTAQPEGGTRVRWVDRKGFWLSLTATGSPDSVRALVERIR